MPRRGALSGESAGEYRREEKQSGQFHREHEQDYPSG